MTKKEMFAHIATVNSADAEIVAFCEKEIELLKANAQKTRENAINAQFDEQSDLLAHRSHYAAGLWTGVGIGAAGLILAGVGAGLAIANNDDGINFKKNETNNEIKPTIKIEHDIYWTVLGIGIGSAVLGSVITGIFGYYYTHLESNRTNTVSFYTTANGLGFSF